MEIQKENDELEKEIDKLEKNLPVGIDLANISQSCDNLLTEYTRIWAESGVEELDMSSLGEAFLGRQKLRTDNSVIQGMLKIDVDTLEIELQQDEKELEFLEKFLGGLERKTPEEIKQEHLSLTKQWTEFNQKITTRSSSINLDEIIRKVELLEGSTKKQSGIK